MAKEVLNIGCVDYPPYFYKSDNSKIEGLGVETLNKLLSKKYELRFHMISLGRGESALNEGIIDVYSGYGQHVKEKRKILFSSKAYLKLNPSICGYEVFVDSYKDLKLDNKYLIYPKGSEEIDQFKNMKINYIYFEYASNYLRRAYGMLAKKRADYFIVPSTKSIEVEGFKKAKCLALYRSFSVYLTYKLNSPLKKKLDPLLAN